MVKHVPTYIVQVILKPRVLPANFVPCSRNKYKVMQWICGILAHQQESVTENNVWHHFQCARYHRPLLQYHQFVYGCLIIHGVQEWITFSTAEPDSTN